MNPWTKTLAMIAAAGLMAGLVYVTRPVAKEPKLTSDQGQPLAPLLTDPLAVKALEVISYDEQSAKMRAFKVAFVAGKWVVPSHSGYPADAADKVSAAASAFAGLIKERVASDIKADHASLGVLEPTEENLAAGGSGVGVHVTLRDATDRALADLIIGKPLKSDTAASPFEAKAADKRYVREVGSNRVYVTSLNTGFSTKFIDWVDPDLLKTTSEQITSLGIDRYQIDSERGITKEPQTITLAKAPPPPVDPSNPQPQQAPAWTLTANPGGGPGPGQVINDQRVNEAVTTLTGLKIVGVRPKPANLAKALGGAAAEVKLTVADQLSLQSRGFYLSQGNRLLANEGQMAVKCTDGVVYNLWFGEVVPDGEDAVSGGQVGGAGPTEADASKPKTPSNARYMMITVAFDPALAPEPARPQALIDAEAAFAKAKADFEAQNPKPADAPAPAEGEAPQKPDAEPPKPAPPTEPDTLVNLRKQHQASVDSWKASTEGGKKRAESLSKRFADWYYVISADSLTKLRPTRDELVKAEDSKPAPAPSAPQTPTLPVPLQSPQN